MSELFSILPGCLVIGVILGIFAFFYRRNQQKQTESLVQSAMIQGFEPIQEPRQLSGLQSQVDAYNFAFFQRGGSTKITSALQSNSGTIIELLQTRAAPGSDADRYTAFLTAVNNPPAEFVLRVRTLQVDNAINRALFGAAKEVDLAAWPTLANMYQCLSADPSAIEHLLKQWLGDWLTAEVKGKRVRNIELSNGGLLVYQYERQAVDQGRLSELVAAAQHILQHLSDQ